ncbi:MAG: DNA-binding protein WhiA [Clostridia bacterium]|nr:DNA-binding protein WhiA [Clostridia bacterium]
MSFSSKVKDELVENTKETMAAGLEKNCCHLSLQYGLFLFCRNFSANEISIKTENKGIAELFCDAAREITGTKPSMGKSPKGKFTVKVESEEARQVLLSEFGYSGTEISFRLNEGIVANSCCKSAMLRGAFLSCGSVTNPEKAYHVEFVMPHKALADDFIKFLESMGFSPKHVSRNGSHVVYFKDSESIEDLLTTIGATDSTLDMMGTKMYKDMRNKVNRRMNFENANSSRAFDAAYKQMEAIRFIESTRGLEALSSELREIAILRINNPEFTLKELGEALPVPISKSGVNHRLQKIMEYADDIRLIESVKE